MILTSGSSAGLSRVMLFIDGGYLRRYISEISDSDIDYSNLRQFLTSSTALGNVTPQLIRAYYYDGMPDIRDVELMPEEIAPWALEMIEPKQRAQEEYVNKIRMTDLFDVRLGQMVLSTSGGIQQKDNWSFRQKGVDTLIAIDMITKAYQDQYDVAVLVAGDADFIEVVEAVKNAGPRVMGVYFEKHVKRELEYAFDKRQVLFKDLLIRNGIIKDG